MGFSGVLGLGCFGFTINQFRVDCGASGVELWCQCASRRAQSCGSDTKASGSRETTGLCEQAGDGLSHIKGLGFRVYLSDGCNNAYCISGNLGATASAKFEPCGPKHAVHLPSKLGWPLKPSEKLFLDMILLNPIRENTTCPKALPSKPHPHPAKPGAGALTSWKGLLFEGYLEVHG